MKEIKLSKGFVAIIDDKDYERVSQHKWHVRKSRTSKTFYATAFIGEKTTGLHRFIMNPPQEAEIDHKDGNGLDNRTENLRVCTREGNMRNRRPNGKCPFKGVFIDGNKFISQISLKNTQYRLGFFDTPEQAALEYDNAAIEHYGEFAWLNKDHFPELVYTKKEFAYKRPEKRTRINVEHLVNMIKSAELSRRDKKILIRTLQGKTLKQIGNKIGLTKERIRQIRKDAVSYLRRFAKRQGYTYEQFIIN